MKKKLFIGAAAFLGILISAFAVNSASAAQNGSNYGYGNMGAMMRNLNSNDFQRMSEAHDLMAEGKYDQARKIMQDLGCPMLNGNVGNSNGNYGGMMGNFSR